VTSQLTGKYTVVRINDWGPERDKFPERVIDLDAVAFKEFAPLGAGVIRVDVEPIGPDDPDYAMADAMPASATLVSAPKPAPVPAPEPEPAWAY
jgi:rare lipoprotein A (peptidoglycan hydrolase)